MDKYGMSDQEYKYRINWINNNGYRKLKTNPLRSAGYVFYYNDAADHIIQVCDAYRNIHVCNPESHEHIKSFWVLFD